MTNILIRSIGISPNHNQTFPMPLIRNTNTKPSDYPPAQ